MIGESELTGRAAIGKRRIHYDALAEIQRVKQTLRGDLVILPVAPLRVLVDTIRRIPRAKPRPGAPHPHRAGGRIVWRHTRHPVDYSDGSRCPAHRVAQPRAHLGIARPT